MGKWKVFAAAAAMALLFSSCSLTFSDAEGLLQPPHATGDQQTVQGLIEEAAGDNYVLRYPKVGSFRSAMTMSEDLTGDGKTDVVGFFETPDESGGTTLALLSADGGSWRIVSSFAKNYVRIDRICFGDLNGDGVKELVVGWGTPLSQTGNICAYRWDGNGFTEFDLAKTYSEFAVVNLDALSGDELVVIDASRPENSAQNVGVLPATAKLYKIIGNAMTCVSQTELDPSVVKYTQLITGYVDKDRIAVVLDGVKADNSLMTEVIYWDAKSEMLMAPYTPKEGSTGNPTQRDAAATVVSKDINADGFIEIPTAKLFAGCEESGATLMNYVVTWNRFDTETGELLPAMNTLVNYTDGYWFLIPDSWNGQVTCDVNSAAKTITFYEWKYGQRGDLLLRLKKTSAEENAADGSQGWVQLEKKNNALYLAKAGETKNLLEPEMTDVDSGFHLIS